jgi:hypothetical protein
MSGCRSRVVFGKAFQRALSTNSAEGVWILGDWI